MTQSKKEAAPIARLIGDDGERTVGWVYLWNTSELSILWVEGKGAAKIIDPPICSQMLARAKPATPENVMALLQVLSPAGSHESE